MRKSRVAVRRPKDRFIFRRTADLSKSVNVRPVLMRGGFRL